jgi:hypothetical protein
MTGFAGAELVAGPASLRQYLPEAQTGRAAPSMVSAGGQALGASCQTPSSILALRWLRLTR